MSHVGFTAMATTQGKGSSYRDPKEATEAVGRRVLPGHSCSQALWSLFNTEPRPCLPSASPAQHLALSHTLRGPATTRILAILMT